MRPKNNVGFGFNSRVLFASWVGWKNIVFKKKNTHLKETINLIRVMKTCIKKTFFQMCGIALVLTITYDKN